MNVARVFSDPPLKLCGLLRQIRYGSTKMGDLGTDSASKGGSVRAAGGVFGKGSEAANEEEYFLKLKSEQIKKIISDQMNPKRGTDKK